MLTSMSTCTMHGRVRGKPAAVLHLETTEAVMPIREEPLYLHKRATNPLRTPGFPHLPSGQSNTCLVEQPGACLSEDLQIGGVNEASGTFTQWMFFHYNCPRTWSHTVLILQYRYPTLKVKYLKPKLPMVDWKNQSSKRNLRG